MRKSIKALAIASAVIASLAVAPALYAHDSEESGDAMMGSGMVGMMNMMGQMSQMIATWNQMVQAMIPHRREEPLNPGQAPKKNKG